MKAPSSQPLPLAVIPVLRTLNDMPHFRWQNSKARIGLVARAISMVLCFAAAFCLFAIATFAALHLWQPLGRGVLQLVLVLAVLMQLFWLLAMALDVVSEVISLYQFHKHQGALVLEECLFDHGNAARLSQFPSEVLKAADRWIDQKIKREERRLSYFFGGHDKLALFALAGMLWLVWKETGPTLLDPGNTPILLGVAAGVGMALGGLMSRHYAEKLKHQRDILLLANEQPPLAPGPTSPPPG